MMKSVFIGCGAYLPQRILSNAELAKTVDTSDEWIVARTGISNRHIAADGELTLTLRIDEFRQPLTPDVTTRLRQLLRLPLPGR